MSVCISPWPCHVHVWVPGGGKRPTHFYWNAYQQAAGLLNSLWTFCFARHMAEMFIWLKHDNNSFLFVALQMEQLSHNDYNFPQMLSCCWEKNKVHLYSWQCKKQLANSLITVPTSYQFTWNWRIYKASFFFELLLSVLSARPWEVEYSSIWAKVGKTTVM